MAIFLSGEDLTAWGVALFGIVAISWYIYDSHKEKVERERANARRLQELIEKYKHLSVEEVILSEDLELQLVSGYLLTTIHHLSADEINELLESAERAKKKARLGDLKRNIRRKAYEVHSNVPLDDKREPIPEEIRTYVWNRDAGKCVKCGSRDNLEFDHIVPIVKGGSNTARNIELLCERCNRAKSDEI